MVRANNIQKKKKNKSKKKTTRKTNLRTKAIEEIKEEIISLEESDDINKSEIEEEIKKPYIKLKNKKRGNSYKNKRLLNKKKLKSKEKRGISINNKKLKKEDFEEPEEIEEEEESEDIEENEKKEDNIIKEKEEKFLPISNESDNKRKSRKKEDIEKINISDYQEDPSLTCKNHNIIEECCLECNERNIFRAIKTNDKILFTKCLKARDKIPEFKEYKLHMVRNISLLEYINKSRNKTLLVEYANYIIYHDWE